LGNQHSKDDFETIHPNPIRLQIGVNSIKIRFAGAVMTLRAKASILLGILISFTLGGLGYYSLVFFERSLHDSILKGLSSVGETSSQAISRFLTDTLLEAQAVAQALPKHALENRDAETIENRLKEFLNIFPKFENGMFILDKEGKLWTDYPAHPQVRGKRFDFRQYFRKTMEEKKGIIGTPYRSARTGQPVLTFTAVLRDTGNRIIGLLGCSVQLTSPKALEGIRLTRIGQSGYIYVYSKDRLMILHPKKERILKKDVPVGANKLFDDAIRGFEGTGETVNSRGVEMLISLKHIPDTRWIIGAQQPKNEAYAPIREARAKIKMAIFIAAILSVFLGALFMRKLTGPLFKLQEASQLLGRRADRQNGFSFESNEFNEKLDEIRESGEIGDLVIAFKTMHENLNQVMRSLQESVSDWENTFDSVDDIIFLLDQENRIIRLNKTAVRLIETSVQDPVGRSIFDCLKNLPGDFTAGHNPADNPKGNILKVVIETEAGERTYEISYNPFIDGENKNIGTVLSGKDITLRLAAEEAKMELEKKLHKAKKMEAIGTLAGGVAHDLNNILSGVVSYPELLLVQLPEDSPLKKPLETILQSGIKASAIVQDLLTLARRGVATIEVVDLNKIIKDYLSSPEFKKLIFHHPDVAEETHLDFNLLHVEGSPVHLSKTIMNLVSNAAEAMPQGGKITITTYNKYVDTPIKGYDDIAEGDYVVLEVSDEGLGISENDMERIFEPFYTKKKMGRSGTGLGMSVVWGTVKDQNGYIDVESRIDSGTKFTLYFPATRKTPAEGEDAFKLDELHGNGETLLVIDDIEDQRIIAVSILNELGYSVNAVPGGLEAVEYLKEHPVDLLVLDMIMDPGIDGLETYKRVLKILPGQRAIITSGFSETGNVKKAQELGAGEYIKKPYTMKNLGTAVKKELSKKKALH
jgi:signal transduction histidine kinase/ActR/RegA family two-component response regulator